MKLWPIVADILGAPRAHKWVQIVVSIGMAVVFISYNEDRCLRDLRQIAISFALRPKPYGRMGSLSFRTALCSEISLRKSRGRS